jgi:hypothetical protein
MSPNTRYPCNRSIQRGIEGDLNIYKIHPNPPLEKEGNRLGDFL